MSYFNELIRLEVLIWLLPAAFFIHDGEEIITMEKWLRKHKDQPRIAENRIYNWEKNITFQFTVAVLLLGSLLFLATCFAAGDFENSGKPHPLFVGIIAILFLDGIKHVGYTVMLKKYTPGFITAGLVEIPFTAYALYRFYDAEIRHERKPIKAGKSQEEFNLAVTAIFSSIGDFPRSIAYNNTPTKR